MDLAKEKERLISDLISEGYLKSPEVIAAFRKVARENFVLPQDRAFAYSDNPLHIMAGQTISAPHMCAIMIELLELNGGERILEIGAGSGYNAALMSELVGPKGKITSIEISHELAALARRNLQSSGYKNVKVSAGDATLHYEKDNYYDRIIATCACPEIPKGLIPQLKEGGIILVPVDSWAHQELILGRKVGTNLKLEKHGSCIFVPLRHE